LVAGDAFDLAGLFLPSFSILQEATFSPALLSGLRGPLVQADIALDVDPVAFVEAPRKLRRPIAKGSDLNLLRRLISAYGHVKSQPRLARLRCLHLRLASNAASEGAFDIAVHCSSLVGGSWMNSMDSGGQPKSRRNAASTA
jgi:hypothetical protein